MAGSLPIRPILVVDDDPMILETVSEILGDEGYPVVTASNGLEALDMLEHAHPAIVLLDMRMPVLDGWGFAREVKARGVHVNVLVMTAAQDAREWAREIGAADFLGKPFEITDLLDAVERLCGRP